MKQPTAKRIRNARIKAGLNQAQAAALVHLSSNIRWCEYETGTRNIDLARWELFLIKTGRRKVKSKGSASDC